MKWSTTTALVTAAFALMAMPGASQSLTDAAAKEKERRAKAKAGKVYTDKELQSAGGASNSAPSTTDVAVPGNEASPKPTADGTAPPPTPEEELAKKQDEWRKRRDKASTEAAAFQAEADRIQSVLNDNTKSQYGAGRQEAVAALEQAKAKQAAAQQQVTAIEEEGRRNRYR